MNSLYLDPDECHARNVHLLEKFDEIKSKEQRFETYHCDEKYDLLVTAFGMMARICKTAIDVLAGEGVNVGLFRPITLNPYPYEACREAMDKAERVMCIEMNMGQMIQDISLAGEGTKQIDFYGKAGGVIPSVGDVAEQMREAIARAGSGEKATRNVK